MAKADTLLKDYRAKRDFARTQEPKGAGLKQAKPAQLAFIVQKHDATRLHYDFRIEFDGVLKSWAVTRGPSDTPEDKRLAVRVEDHPLEYGGFEGTIPQKQYGGGTVMLWDTGTWEPIGDPHEGLRKGDLKMRLHGQRMKGEWVLVHMKGRDEGKRQNWLLIKHRDKYARDEGTLTERFTRSVSTGRDLDGIAKGLKPKKKTRTPAKAVWKSNRGDDTETSKARRPRSKGLKLPEFRAPQLATLVDEAPDGDEWLFELKYDGYRCVAAVSGKDVRFYTRNGLDWTEQFSVLVDPFSRLTGGSALIDGEICAFNGQGRTDFSTLKTAIGKKEPLVFFAFDLLEADGETLARKPLTERKERLEKLLGRVEATSPIQYSDHIVGNGQKVLDGICKAGHEGVIGKLARAPYRSERSKSWLKIKCIKRQEFVIGGWTTSTKKKTFASLLLGTFEDGELIYRGRVGTGFNAGSAADLQARLDKLARETNPYKHVPRPMTRGVNWVEPKLVAEVEFTEFTPDGSLRHPSFQGLREDKAAGEIVMEKAQDTEAVAAKAEKPRKSRTSTKAVDLSDDTGIAAAKSAGVKLTSPDRVVYPQQGVTKARLVAYYAAVAERMLPYIGDRPLSLVRCPQGMARHCFFQKHDSGGFPKEMKSVEIVEKDGEKQDYFYIDDLAGLIAGTQMNVLEWHLWGSGRRSIEKPERLIFDIDPDVGLGFDAVRDAAFDIRDLLTEIGLESFPLVSGGKGVHVIVPIRPKLEWPDVKEFCHTFARLMAEREPDRFTAQLSKAKRKGKLFIDYLRNERGATAIAPWSTRSREGAPVAVPVSWKELKTIEAANQFSLAEAAARAAQKTDPWAGYFDTGQTISKAIRSAIGE